MRKRSFSLLARSLCRSLVMVSPSNADLFTYNYLGNPFATLGTQPMGEYITAPLYSTFPRISPVQSPGGPPWCHGG